MAKSFLSTVACLGLFLAGASAIFAAENSQLRLQVEETEKSFAQTMADRDFDAFRSFLSEETIFFSGDTPLEGKQAVADAWESFFSEPQAPFSWEPQTVAVLESGTLALSSGPVYNSAGKRVGTFNSIWRLNEQGDWRIIFDKGGSYCEPPAPADEQ